jgi:hypothetical protein
VHGYSTGHPKARYGSGPRRFSNNNKHVTNHVSKDFSKEDGQLVVGISKAQLKQLLSLLNNKNEGSGFQANAITNQGFSEVASRSWIIDSGATNHISSSSKLFFSKDKKCSLPLVLLPSREKANIVAKGSLPLNSI